MDTTARHGRRAADTKRGRFGVQEGKCGGRHARFGLGNPDIGRIIPRVDEGGGGGGGVDSILRPLPPHAVASGAAAACVPEDALLKERGVA